MLPKTLCLSCWASLALLCGGCGDDIQATAYHAGAGLEAPDPVREELRTELSARAGRYRERLSALRTERLELEERLSILNSEDLLGPQANAWRDRLRELRLENDGLREELDTVLEEIADLSRSR